VEYLLVKKLVQTFKHFFCIFYKFFKNYQSYLFARYDCENY